ncbi:hypothetical protein DPMN_168194 [Dreissena polymorpha]|uniref:Uncharacterized protein n=1 Tax=Dreissena polymorpha TaxID=45954 RepID=A0A9D4F4N1_DREPO|nr:hypothetical protein DPMN_168194 [Dreissena polymorpha]
MEEKFLKVKFDPRGIICTNLKEVHPRNIPEKFHQNWTCIGNQEISDLTKNISRRQNKINVLTNFHEEINSLLPGRKVFKQTHIIRKNVLTKNIAQTPGGHVFQPTLITFKITIIVASRVLTRKNAPPPGAHAFQPTKTMFKLVQDIIGTNLLTKFN